jgi:putative transcriptional regulator
MEHIYDTVIEEKDYGRVLLNVKEIMDKKGINRNMLARLAGIRFEVANRLYTGNVYRLDLDVLARVLHVLQCSVEDIIQYEPANK